MNELRPKADGSFTASERLALEVGVLAGRLARLLARSLPAAGSAVANGQAFLWATFEAVSNGESLEATQNLLRQREGLSPTQPLGRLVNAFSLTRDEVDLLVLGGMAEEHEGLAAVLRGIHPAGEPRVSVGLAAQLICSGLEERGGFRRMVETSVALRSGAVRLGGDGPLFERSLLPAASLWPALHEIDIWPGSIRRIEGPAAAAGLEEWFEARETARAVAALRQRERCTILVLGDSEENAFNRALAMVQQSGFEPAGILLPAAVDPDVEKLIQLHTVLRGVVPVLKLAAPEGPGAPVAPEFGHHPGPIVVCGRWGGASACVKRPLIAVPVNRMSPVARRRMWREAVPELASDASFLAARYPVEPTTAAEVVADLRFLEKMGCSSPTVADVAASVRARGGLTLSGGVKLIRPVATFADLVLPEDRLAQLREAVQRLLLQARVFDDWGYLKARPGARGVRMLFAGPPGTGKTLSAEVIANALNVDLLAVDISRVVSKWIGETEKNLAAVFDTAERAQAVLFFDEADALFGKRTEVSDAHDRYANLETAYLLARLERFEGLAIMATNLRQNIDPAFLRRLEFVVDFEEPGREERLALWRCHVPKEAPVGGDVDFSELAALYPIVGGVIRNAAVAAGFLAAAEGSQIVRSHLVHAIRREYEKSGRAFPGFPAGMECTRPVIEVEH